MKTNKCQSTGEDFEITADDLIFYEQMYVPAPTFSPHERFLRRLSWCGYNHLHKRICDKTGDTIISIWPEQTPYPVYRQDIWWGDDWDPLEYGMEYDFSKNFFDQYRELMNRVPRPSLFTDYSTMINSDYCNGAGYLKNCYLFFKADYAEDSAYGNTLSDGIKDCFDIAYATQCELCYDVLNCNKCYQVFWSQHCVDSRNLYFCSDVSGCSDCFGCINLRNKQCCIFNEQYTKEEYKEKMKAFDWSTHAGLQSIQEQVHDFFMTQPRRAVRGYNNVDVSGDNLFNCKNVHQSHFMGNCEDLKYCDFLKSGNARKCCDYSLFGLNAEWIYESAWVGLTVNNLKFCYWNYHAHHLEYCFGCHGSENLFGCVGVRKGQYCILNKQYTKEEYFKMVEKIKQQMMDVPYIDSKGRAYRYGEFFPSDMSPWGYNETQGQEFFPLSKEEALQKGFKWTDSDTQSYRSATIEIPKYAKDAPNDFVQEILQCEASGKNYRLIPMELQFYKRFNIPIPKKHPMVRDRERVAKLNPPKLYKRTCAKTGVAILTTYAPDRPEIVWSEEAYRDEFMS